MLIKSFMNRSNYQCLILLFFRYFKPFKSLPFAKCSRLHQDARLCATLRVTVVARSQPPICV